jgi:hypothetical protein
MGRRNTWVKSFSILALDWLLRFRMDFRSRLNSGHSIGQITATKLIQSRVPQIWQISEEFLCLAIRH